jgi:hypothetical protein
LVSALRSGRRGPRFKSGQPDQKRPGQGLTILRRLAPLGQMARKRRGGSWPLNVPEFSGRPDRRIARRCPQGSLRRPFWGRALPMRDAAETTGADPEFCGKSRCCFSHLGHLQEGLPEIRLGADLTGNHELCRRTRHPDPLPVRAFQKRSTRISVGPLATL